MERCETRERGIQAVFNELINVSLVLASFMFGILYPKRCICNDFIYANEHEHHSSSSKHGQPPAQYTKKIGLERGMSPPLPFTQQIFHANRNPKSPYPHHLRATERTEPRGEEDALYVIALSNAFRIILMRGIDVKVVKAFESALELLGGV